MLAAQSPEYDLLLKGGHVLDPKNGVDAVRDLAIADGRIAAIEPEIPSSKAKKTLDAEDLYVTPGLIDSHFHAFAGTENSSITAGLSSIFPDHVTFGSCVTTVVDVGSSGWRRNTPMSSSASSRLTGGRPTFSRCARPWKRARWPVSP